MPKWQLRRVFSRLDDIARILPSLSLIHFEIYVEGASKIELRSVARQKWAWTKTCTLVWGLENLIVLLWLLLCAACLLVAYEITILQTLCPPVPLWHETRFSTSSGRDCYFLELRVRERSTTSPLLYLSIELNHRCLGENSRAQFETGRISFVRQ